MSTNTTVDRPCVREDVEGFVVQHLVFTVDSSGIADDFLSKRDYEPADIEQYGCLNCGKHWSIARTYDDAARAAAWQAVVDHFGRQDA